MSDNNLTGSRFDDFLEEEGIYEEVTARAHKRLFALQVADNFAYFVNVYF